MPSVLPPPVQIQLSDGMVEALKFLALVLMVLDHINRFVLGGNVPTFFYLGRLAFPLFAVILGWNLARPGLFDPGAGSRMLKRLFLFGLVASFPYNAMLDYQWWQLNILFTLWAGAAIIYLFRKQDVASIVLAAALFAGSGMVVDYAWHGVTVCITSWAYCRRPTWLSFFGWIASIASLAFINGNFLALLSVPILLFASRKEIRFPRYRYFFYWFYPFHLAVLGLVGQA